MYKEAEALRSLTHQNIVKLKYTFPIIEKKMLVIVMEYASGGELKVDILSLFDTAIS